MTFSNRFSTSRYSVLYRLARDTLSNPKILRSDLREQALAAAEGVGASSDNAARDQLLSDLTRCYYLSGEYEVLINLGIPLLGYNPNYDLKANSAGPWMPIPFERPVVDGKTWELFGRPIGLPIGIPASALTLNAKFIRFYAQCGFNVLTYKTVRTKARPPHDPPHWFFLHGETTPWKMGENPVVVHIEPREWPSDRDSFSTANSFGVPSADPSEWQEDVALSLNALAADQLLILSVMGTEAETGTADDLVADFARGIRLGLETGVRVFEINLSCPNVINPSTGRTGDHLICHDPLLSRQIVEACSAVLDGDAKLVAKLSWMPESELRRGFGPLIAEGHLSGLAGINTLPAQVESWPNEEAFPGRPSAGVSGIALRNYSQDFLASCLRMREQVGDFEVLLSGGIITPHHAFESLREGANVVQSATGAFANAELAAECVDAYVQSGSDDWPSRIPEPAHEDVSAVAPTPTASTEALLRVLSDAERPCSFEDIQELLGVSRDEVTRVISGGEALGLITTDAVKGVFIASLSDAGAELLKVPEVLPAS